jgi:regulator of replication initiation timing
LLLSPLSIENEDLKKRLEAQITSIKKEFSETVQVAKQANMSSNYNEQYSDFVLVF